ncbi:MAG TPA: hypothetical protein VJ233_11330, partial [Hyphomicrobiaceae bacterium]|nr:hypothetical protein [Hyphomicrobiaceae bacterium]
FVDLQPLLSLRTSPSGRITHTLRPSLRAKRTVDQVPERSCSMGSAGAAIRSREHLGGQECVDVKVDGRGAYPAPVLARDDCAGRYQDWLWSEATHCASHRPRPFHCCLPKMDRS